MKNKNKVKSLKQVGLTGQLILTLKTHIYIWVILTVIQVHNKPEKDLGFYLLIYLSILSWY